MSNTVYNDKYREACFYVWYDNGRPHLKSKNGTHVLKLMPPDEEGKKPGFPTISRWMNEDGWIQHADALDAEVSLKLDQDAIENRVKTLRELAENGRTLKQKGLDYLKNNDDPFKENPSAAVRAIVAGSEMEFKYAGQADLLANVAGMSNKQLDKELARLLGRSENEIIEGESEDVEESEESEESENVETDND